MISFLSQSVALVSLDSLRVDVELMPNVWNESLDFAVAEWKLSLI